MDQGPLVREQIDAGARFLAAFGKSYPVRAAFWLKESEAGNWYLYVASNRITDKNFDVAYGEVLRVARHLKDPWFDPLQVKVIGGEDPLAQAALERLRGIPGRPLFRLYGEGFGGVSAEEIYLYPSPVSAPA